MKTTLVLVDIQNDYFPSGKMELEGSMEAGLKAQKLLAWIPTLVFSLNTTG